jgi:hypothetical protein
VNDNGAIDTHFVHPQATSSYAACPIISTKAVLTNDVNAAHASLFAADSTVGVNKVTTPLSIATHDDYLFYIVWTAEGGATAISTIKELRVGCTPSMTITEAPTFGLISAYGVGDPTTNIYTVVPPLCDRQYCTVTSYTTIDTLFNNAPQPSSAFMSTTCASPGSASCLTVDVFSTATISNIKFKIKALFNSDPALVYTSS